MAIKDPVSTNIPILTLNRLSCWLISCGISHLVRKFMVTTPAVFRKVVAAILAQLSAGRDVVGPGIGEDGDLIAVPEERVQRRVEGRGVGDWQSGTQQLSETGQGEEEEGKELTMPGRHFSVDIARVTFFGSTLLDAGGIFGCISEQVHHTDSLVGVVGSRSMRGGEKKH